MATTLYGIKNCDTIKKARKWLEVQQVDYQFHDYRQDGITPEMLDTFCVNLSWEQLLNKRGTTYRQLSEEQKADMTQEKAKALLLGFPAMIKRPVLLSGDDYHLGFKADSYQSIFSK